MTEIHAIIWLVSTTVIAALTYVAGRNDVSKLRDERYLTLMFENDILRAKLAGYFRNGMRS